MPRKTVRPLSSAAHEMSPPHHAPSGTGPGYIDRRSRPDGLILMSRMTPTRAGRLADASVDPTEARNSDTGLRVRQSDVAKPIKLAVHARWPHPLPTICPLTLVRLTRILPGSWMHGPPDAIKAGIIAMIEAALVR